MDDELQIRTARIDEQAALEAMQRRASLVWDDHRADLEAHPDAIELPPEQLAGGHVFIAERQGRALGFGVVLPREDGQAELDGLFVEPDAWGLGVGRRLIEEAARLARSRGAAALHVVGNSNAEGFYLACGFELLGEAATRFGPALAMRLRLG
jgi:GNAT superfamily N-acetyltransferase